MGYILKTGRICFLLFFFAAVSACSIEARDYSILAVRVEFPYEDPDHDTTSGRGTFDLRNYYDENETALRAQYRNPWDVPPHDRRYFDNHLQALRNYWNTVSEGRVDISYDIYPREQNGAYTLSKKFYKYGNGRTKEETNRKLVELLEEALLACKNAEGRSVDFSRYDTFMVIHAGIGSETSGALNDIPSAFITTEDIDTYLASSFVIDGKSIDNGIVVPEMAAANGYGGLNGIMAQMFGHRLGLPSLSNNEDGLPAAGGWCLMDTGSMSYGYTTRGFVPTHPCAWSKMELGWIEPVVVTSDTTLDIAATHIDNGLPRAVRIPISDQEYLLIENRIRYAPRDSLPEVTFSDTDTSGVWLSVEHYDAYIPGSGILVWHINDAIISAKRKENAVNDDMYRRGVDLLEADGREDIGALIGFGDPRGEYTEGHDDDTLKKGGISELGPETKPDTGSMWGARSGVTIQVNSDVGDVMNVTITFEGVLNGFPAHVGSGGHVTAFDIEGDGADELVASNSNEFFVYSSQGTILFPHELLFNHPAALRMKNSNIPALFSGKRNEMIYLYDANGSLEVETIIIDSFANYQTSFRGNPLSFTGADGQDSIVIFAPSIYDSGEMRTSVLFSDYNEQMPLQCCAFPDTVHVASMSAVSAALGLLGKNNTLYLGTIGDGIPDVYQFDAVTVFGPVMADFDRDDVYETAVLTDRGLMIFEPDGLSHTAFLPGKPTGEPALADINNDGYPEVVFCTERYICAYGRNAIQTTGFPFRMPPGDDDERFSSPPVIADLDGDGIIDIAAATTNRRLVSYSIHGAPTHGFPIAIRGEVTTPACVFHHEASGKLGLAYITADGYLMAHDLGVTADDTLLPWPMWKGGPGLSASLPNGEINSSIPTTAAFEAYCYPNPITQGSGTFRVIPSGETDLTITVFTADGIKVFEGGLTQNEVVPGVPNEIRMNAADLASGLYIAKIATRQKTVFYKLGVLR